MRPNGDFPPRMKGATNSTAGRRGLVPPPQAGDENKPLHGDGNYKAITNAVAATNAEAAAGISTTTFVTPANAQYAVANKTNALAPAQALSSNGTAGSTLTLASTPSGNQSWAFDIDVPAAAPSAANGIFNAGGDFSGANTFGAYIAPTTGILYINQYAASAPNFRQAVTARSIVTTYGGTRIRCVIAIASGVLTLRINDVAQTLTETTSGTPPAWGATLASDVVFIGKLSSANYYFSGAIRLLGIENYALSTAQQTYVYQTGSFPASDFPSPAASNTSIITGADSTFASDTGYWTKSGATIGSGVCTLSAGGYIYHSSLNTPGQRRRITVTVNSIVGGNLQVNTGNGTVNITGATAPGTYTFDYVCDGTAPLSLDSASGAVIDNVLFYNLGLLVCPDPAQLGSGDYWYDVSGNGATITKPASGVDWVNRWSGTLPATNVGGTLKALTSAKVGSVTGTTDSTLHVYESSAAGTGNGITVEQAGAGDAVIQFLLTGVQRWSAGIDNSDSDAFMLSAGALGTNNVLRATSADISFLSTSAIKGVRTATSILDFPSIAAGASATLTVTVTGSVAGQCAVIAATNESTDMHDGLEFRAWVSAANTVSVKAINRTASIIDQAAYNVRVTVISF